MGRGGGGEGRGRGEEEREWLRIWYGLLIIRHLAGMGKVCIVGRGSVKSWRTWVLVLVEADVTYEIHSFSES